MGFKLSTKLFHVLTAEIKAIKEEAVFFARTGKPRPKGWEEKIILKHFQSRYRNQYLKTDEDYAVLERHLRGGGYMSVVLVTDFSVDGTDGRHITLSPESVKYFQERTRANPLHYVLIKVCGLDYHICPRTRLDWLFKIVSEVRIARGWTSYRGYKKPSPKKGTGNEVKPVHQTKKKAKK